MRAALTVAAMLILAAPTNGQGYRYHGLRQQRGPVTITLDTAHVTAGHIAVWFGANNGTQRWVQAGIAAVDNNQPFIYIETTRHGQPTLQTWPTTLHHHVTVHIVSKGGDWAVHIAGHHSRYVWLTNPAILSVLETYGTATGTAHVNHQTITTGGSL